MQHEQQAYNAYCRPGYYTREWRKRMQIKQKIAEEKTIIVRSVERNTDQLSTDHILMHIMHGERYHP